MALIFTDKMTGFELHSDGKDMVIRAPARGESGMRVVATIPDEDWEGICGLVSQYMTEGGRDFALGEIVVIVGETIAKIGRARLEGKL